MATTQPIRSKKQVKRLADHFLERGEYRNHVLIVFSVHTALRISDTLSLRWNDVYDFELQNIRSELTLTESKTGKQKTIMLHKHIVKALKLYSSMRSISPDTFLFESRKPNNFGHSRAISRVQAHRIIKAASEALTMEHCVSCHSLRKTFGYHAWKSGVSPALIMEIYNHSNFAVTRRYLGIAQDDKNEVYKSLKLLE